MIEKIFIISFIVFAIYTSMQKGMIFEKVGLWLEDHIKSEYWQKPVFACVICMAGIYGAIIYWLIWHDNIKEWIIVNISAIGLNAILSKLIPDDQDRCKIIRDDQCKI